METQVKTQPSDVAAAEEHHFRFMDLSAELRNAVYELCLTSPEPLLIASPSPRRPYTRDPYIRAEPRFELTPGLLASCKAIHGEATSILYGSNHFIMMYSAMYQRHGAAGVWTETIGSSVQHIRAISTGAASDQRALARLWKHLQEAIHLEKLNVMTFSMNFRSAKSAADKLYPLVLHLHKTRKDTDKTAALVVLELEGELAAEIQELLKKRLKL